LYGGFFLTDMKIRDLIAVLEELAPPVFQESYDNSGVITGDVSLEAGGALLCLDCTEAVVEEAIALGCNLIIAHHPILFGAIKSITPRNYVERTLISAIKNDIVIYACHTNLDHVRQGVNQLICEKLGVKNSRILLPKENLLKKLVTFVPASHHANVLKAVFEAGAGHIGDYDSCSFSQQGEGTFRGAPGTQPFLGKPGELSREPETRVEVVLHRGVQKQVIAALIKAHPYEEVAYDLYSLDNVHPSVGSGMIGDLEKPLKEEDFLNLVKETLRVPVIRHTALRGRSIKRVALCGGSGRFLLKNAINAGADAYVTADFKYHEFFDVEGRLLLADAGHYETEQFTPEIFYRVIRKKFSTFAVHLSKINTNPVHYF
jgi:dinuclear metal center YbgI/SA1388 family protein